ncbi:phospho-sugar mutase [Egicoccus halophilus]|uniref:Phosphomannomutase n=1 Tax=Egicoccus halophilus TaxID=1670830 RepID=A0A8J3A9S4_9ACTN|nr:phospho-sugar mutase [Egicoccus halophilus]GGI05536.1 phosphomannomutase [Egicoccus halophilus]
MTAHDDATTAALADLQARATAWIAGDPDETTRAELQSLVDAGDEAELQERVGVPLEFGTAGLRGVVGAGTNRMNRAVVRRTSRGLADHLLATVPDAAQRGVVVGFDARLDSETFARDAVAVFAGAGLQVRWFPSPRPTPLVAYAQKVLDAAAAVVITASHNPPEYNGYKVYAEGAAQIVPPADAAIAAAIEAVGPAKDLPLADPLASELVAPVPASVVDRYLDELAAARPDTPGPDLTLVYTPLHGVGGELVQRAMAAAGFDDLHVVPSQAEPDGRFPTVRFPNPEEPGAMDAAVELAREVDADLVIANDPDADRLAAAVPDGAGGYRLLTGNQIGVLLTDHLLSGTDADRPLVVASIVSTPMFRDVAAAHGAHAEFTLTGFKWICAAARDLERADGRSFVYGFEEALGSSVGTVVRDKDGIGAAVAFAGLARSLAAEGRTVADRLEELYRRHGLWVSHQHSITRPGTAGLAEIAQAMASLAERVPEELAGQQVLSTLDYRVGAEQRPPWLEAHDMVAIELTDGRALIRPSGTEPKLKIYVDLRGELRQDDDLEARSTELLARADAVARDLASFVGLG